MDVSQGGDDADGFEPCGSAHARQDSIAFDGTASAAPDTPPPKRSPAQQVRLPNARHS
jgi:hypothetical protein